MMDILSLQELSFEIIGQILIAYLQTRNMNARIFHAAGVYAAR